jgi:hypothetical protein
MLTGIGGADLGKSIYNILRFLFAPELALNVRLTATSGKIAFMHLKLAEAIRG